MPEQPEPHSMHPRPAVDCQAGQRTDNPDGSYTVTLPGVASVHCSRDGDIEAKAPTIRAVTIADLSKVVEHNITRLYDTVSLGHQDQDEHRDRKQAVGVSRLRD